MKQFKIFSHYTKILPFSEKYFFQSYQVDLAKLG